MKTIRFIAVVILLIVSAVAAYALTEVQVDRATREVNVSFWDRARDLIRSVQKKPKIGIDGEPINTEEGDDGAKDEENSDSRDF